MRIAISKPANIRIEADAVSPNTFLRLVGIDQTPVAVMSEAMMGNRLEVALVLDNTGSMKGTARRRRCARPFGSSSTASWPSRPTSRWQWCRSRNMSMSVSKTATPRGSRWVPFKPLKPGPVASGRGSLPLDESDRRPQAPYPILHNKPRCQPITFCPGPLTPLTADKSVVMSAANAMVMNGNTYIPAGLMWGWNVLTPEPPFTEARASGVRKAMVLMTDG